MCSLGESSQAFFQSGQSWCLQWVGMNTKWLLLEGGHRVTIGRGFSVTHQLVSEIFPLMISHNHCVLKQNPEGQWTIMDSKTRLQIGRDLVSQLQFCDCSFYRDCMSAERVSHSQ
uniref:FHA domain-containing protein n=1 Tax=Marmota marmota marmota TaxID=9994 RepID=A0A8C5Z0P2_MARMA